MWLRELSFADGVLAGPRDAAPCAGVLVLAGSSGRVERERVALLARHGAVALSLRYFGGPGQTPGICEVPLEIFAPALAELATHSDHVAVLGLSKGAEAALLLGVRDPRVRAIVALSPTAVVWANVGAGRDGATRPVRSSWTVDGAPVPFVPYDESWTPLESTGPPSVRGLYEASLARFPRDAHDAAIPVESFAGELVLVAGADDQVWPSAAFAARIVKRRRDHGRATTSLVGARAGHRVVLPGEDPRPPDERRARGGSPEADAALGRCAWPAIAHALRLGSRHDGAASW